MENISSDAFRSVLAEQNPWLQLESVPPELVPGTRRALAGRLWKKLLGGRPTRFEVLLGPRRVGKTTAMYQTVDALLEQGIAPSRLRWIRLDHPLLMQADLGALVAASSAHATPEQPAFIFLDELTYAADWDLWLKTFHDERRPVRIAATSSSAAALREGRVESGIGRWDEHVLSPWTFDEYLELRGSPAPFDAEPTLFSSIARAAGRPDDFRGLGEARRRFLLVGGFPELLALAPAADEPSEVLRSQRVLRADAVERAIYKDIPQAFGIGEPQKLERLLYVLAGQAGGILSPKKLGTSLELAQPTIDKYVSYLEQSYLVFTLANFSAREESIQRRGRKLYFNDGAVRNAAIMRGLAPLSDPAEMGMLFENAVGAHLHALAQLSAGRLYYFRRERFEVDFVLDDPREPIAFEIASSARHGVEGLRALQREFPRFRGRCFLVAPQFEPKLPSAATDDIGSLPLDLVLRVIGMQCAAAMRARLA